VEAASASRGREKKEKGREKKETALTTLARPIGDRLLKQPTWK
jgi:hypothetical protein